MLDSGSSKSFLNGATLLRLQNSFKRLKIDEVEERCTLANAHTVDINQGVTLAVHFDKFTWKHSFLILESLLTPVILGIDFMTRTGLHMNFDQSSLWVSFNSDYACAVQHDHPPYFCHMSCTQNTVSPAFANLHQNQQHELTLLLNQFPDVLTKELGKTDRGVCELTLTDNAPCRSGPYPLPPPQIESLTPTHSTFIEGRGYHTHHFRLLVTMFFGAKEGRGTASCSRLQES